MAAELLGDSLEFTRSPNKQRLAMRSLSVSSNAAMLEPEEGYQGTATEYSLYPRANSEVGPYVGPPSRRAHPLRSLSPPQLLRRLEVVNKELLLVFSLFAVAGLVNSLVESQRVALGLYTLPTVGSAYLYGRRHATLTAFASILLVASLALFNPNLLGWAAKGPFHLAQWVDMTIWAGTLLVTGYLTGTLCDHRRPRCASCAKPTTAS